MERLDQIESALRKAKSEDAWNWSINVGKKSHWLDFKLISKGCWNCLRWCNPRTEGKKSSP